MPKRKLDLYECAVSARTRWTFVRLETSDGLVGFGECSDAGRADRVRAIFGEVAEAFASLLDTADHAAGHTAGGTAGRAADDPAQILRAAMVLAGPGSGLARRTVVGGVEQAFCDLAARRTGQPLWKWLGGGAGDPVALYANVNRVGGHRRPDDVAAAGASAVADGFATVKCAPFDVPLDGSSLADAGLARLRALRSAVGPHVRLLIDCHERLPISEVSRLAPDLEELDIAWLEDASACTDLAGLRALREAASLPLAGGEVAGVPTDVVPAVEQGLLDIVMPDVKHAAGLLRAMRIGQAVPSVQVSPHNPSGPIATAMSAHLGSSLPNFTMLEYAHGEADWRAELVAGAEFVEHGLLHLPGGPGLGIDLVTDHPALQHASPLTI